MKLRQVGTDPNHPCKVKTRPMRVLWQQPKPLLCPLLAHHAATRDCPWAWGVDGLPGDLCSCRVDKSGPIGRELNAGFEWELWVGSSAAMLASASNGLPRFMFKITEKCLDLFKPNRGSGVGSNVTLQLPARLPWQFGSPLVSPRVWLSIPVPLHALC